MTSIRLHSLTKRYGDTTAVDSISLDIAPGELLFLIGPSGCGKSTALRMIAGLIRPTSGSIFFGERNVTDLPARERNSAMVFQGYALWPHMTVAENVAFGLDVRKVAKLEKEARVRAALESVRLSHLAQRRPAQLSGGEQQRVALARALVVNPAVLLLDEPLSNLDASLRLELRREVKRVCTNTGITAIYVTHDQAEALSMAHRVGVMQKGVLRQVGSPREIYDRPSSRFVAGFLGQANFIPATVTSADDDQIRLDSRVGPIRAIRGRVNVRVGDQVSCVVRPEALRLMEDGASAPNVFLARSVDTVYLGHATEVLVEAADSLNLTLLVPRDRNTIVAGKELRIGFAFEDAVVLVD